MNPWYVLTGGPCAGKTTTIEELKTRGYSVVPESARTVIGAHIAAGDTIESLLAHPLAFEHMILEHQLELMGDVVPGDITFFDRGIPDNVAYYRKFGMEPDEVLKDAIAKAAYKKVFLLDMIEFAGDSERYETSPEEAAQLHEGIKTGYAELGYEIVLVPVMPIAERVDFILGRL